MAKEIHRANSLTQLIKADGLVEIVEIGVCVGRLSRELLARNPDIRLTLVDFWPPDYHLWCGAVDDLDRKEVGIELSRARKQATLEVIAEFSDRARLIEKPSLEAAKEFADGSVDLAFIDADHFYPGVKADILAWEPKVRVWLTGHDYCERFPGVVQAVDEMAVGRELIIMPGDVWAWRVKGEGNGKGN